MGIRNKWSIAYGIAESAYKNGAKLIFTYMGEEKNNSTGLWAKVRCNTIIGWACAKQNGVTYPYLIKA